MEAAAAGSSGLPPPGMTVPSPRGQKRGAPDDDDAAGDGTARGSPRRTAAADAVVEEDEEESSMESDEEEEYDDDYEPQVFDAPPDRQLHDFLRVHPCAGASGGGGATAGSSTPCQAQEPVDVTLRLGVGPLADDTVVDTTLSLRLGPAPPPAAALSEGGGRRFQWPLEPEDGAISAGSTAGDAAGRRSLLRGKPAIIAMLGAAAAADAEPADSDDGGVEVACRVTVADPSDAPSLPRFFDVDDYAFDCFAATEQPANDGAAGRPSSSGVMDLNKACPSGSPDGAPDSSLVPDPAADGGGLAAHVDERRRSSTPFNIDLFRSSVPLFMMFPSTGRCPDL